MIRFKHVGIVVRSIAEYLKHAVVATAGTPVYDDAQKADICFVTTPGTDFAVELIEPKAADALTHNFLAKTGGGLHHVCYGVADLAEAEALIRAKGMRRVFGPVCAPALGGVQVLFAYTRNRELVEFEIG